jgi:FHA domain-containing protein
MKLALIGRTDQQPTHPLEATFEAPGGTIGRGRHNRMVLADAQPPLCRVQAVVRQDDDGWHLANLSEMAAVSINGQPLRRRHDARLRHGDEVTIGNYVLQARDEATSDGTSSSASDVFGDLIGPGTLPVASVSGLTMHPFDMESAAVRNPDDPLAHLPVADWHGDGLPRDPLALFPHNGGAAHQPLSDPTPAMLPADDPLSNRRTGAIADALRSDDPAWRDTPMRDDAPEYGNPLPPPKVRR